MYAKLQIRLTCTRTINLSICTCLLNSIRFVQKGQKSHKYVQSTTGIHPCCYSIPIGLVITKLKSPLPLSISVVHYMFCIPCKFFSVFRHFCLNLAFQFFFILNLLLNPPPYSLSVSSSSFSLCSLACLRIFSKPSSLFILSSSVSFTAV